MMSTVSAADKFSSPQVQILNKSLLPKIDDRLVFLSYVTYGSKGSINVEASASIKTDLMLVNTALFSIKQASERRSSEPVCKFD